MSVTGQIKDFKNLKKKLDNMQKAPRTVIQRTMSDVKSRVPGWIAQEVSSVYGISKKEVDTASGQLGNRHRGTWGDLWSEN